MGTAPVATEGVPRLSSPDPGRQLMHKASRQPSPRGVIAAIVPLVPAMVAAMMATLCAGAARADGAFPDAQGLLLPSDRPNEIMLATTFGVVVSLDGGQTWTYSCEQQGNGALAAV